MGGDFYENSHIDTLQKIKIELGIKDETILLSLGRLSYQKNHQKLIESLNKLKEENFICLIAGDGPLENKIKMQIKKYQLSDKVRILGHRTDVKNLLCISDVLIQASIFEGFPNVFIEAASVGLPIISTDVGSSRTLVNKNGIVVHANDSQELAIAIRKMILNHSLYKKEAMVLRDSNFFKQFHKSEMLKNYISYYKSFLVLL
jgi:glycosyltransferase involved in cell wall biosynthesis